MPWEVDGRGWHTQDRVGRDGRPCQWDGRILDAIERRIQDLGDFAATNWNNRTIVEITAAKKSDGWFFHAITGERWLVKLKFRTAKKTFERDTLVADSALKPLNDLDEIEAYGRGPAGEVQEPSRPLAGSADRCPLVAGDRHAGILVVRGAGGERASRSLRPASRRSRKT